MARPAYRIVAKNKSTGANAEVGVLWASKIQGSFNLSPQTAEADGKLPLADVLAKADEFWLNVYPNEPRAPREDDDFDRF